MSCRWTGCGCSAGGVTGDMLWSLSGIHFVRGKARGQCAPLEESLSCGRGAVVVEVVRLSLAWYGRRWRGAVVVDMVVW